MEEKTIEFRKYSKLPDAVETPALVPEEYWSKKLLEMVKEPIFTHPKHLKPTISGRIRRFFARLRDDIYVKLGGYIDE